MSTRPSATARSNDLVPLAERMNYLQALRVGLALIVLASVVLAESVVGADLSDVLLTTSAYIALAATLEALRRMQRGRGLLLVGVMLLIDGIYLAWALYATGGTQSPLRFLPYLHLIAVTLLASYRTGLKIAFWHSLLFFVVFYAQAAEIIVPNEGAVGLTPDSPEFTRVSFFNVGAFWLVALAAAAFSALNERELRRHRADLEVLAAMAGTLETTVERNAAAGTLLDAVMNCFGFKRGVVFGAPDEGAPLLAHRAPSEADEDSRGVDATIARAWEQRGSVLARRLDDGDKRLSLLLPLARNLIVVPLFAEGDPAGALVLEYPVRHGATLHRRVLEMVEQFAAHGALALRKADLYQRVQKLADTDGLTGLANRRTFQVTLEKELSRAARTGEPLTLMMLDVDHFKRFNDEYGHQMGDEVLRSVAETLVGRSRDFDTPARYGGEEFAVILPGCSSRQSLIVGDRLRKSIAEIDGVPEVTASAGVACFPTHATDSRALIQAADEALYEAKRAGRDRITRSRRRGQSSSRSPRRRAADAAQRGIEIQR